MCVAREILDKRSDTHSAGVEIGRGYGTREILDEAAEARTLQD